MATKEKIIKKIEWTTLENKKTKKDKDWFIAFGIIITAGVIASIFYKNYFFAVFIIISGILLYYFVNKESDVILYEFNNDGLKINNHLVPYKNIRSFFLKDKKDNKKLLLIKIERIFAPIVSISIDNVNYDDLIFLFKTKNIPEEEVEQHFSEKIIEYFEF